MSARDPGPVRAADDAGATLERGADRALDPVAVPGHTPGELRRIHGTVLHRFTFLERAVHWLVGVTFVLLLLTGLAFSYPRLYWMTWALGGGPSARVLHPWVGLLFTVGLAAMGVLWARRMFLEGRDREWLRSVDHYVRHERERVPPAGKFNAGQKVYFWVQLALGVVFLVSGMVLWFPAATSGTLFNVSRLLHYLAALAGGLSLVPHVYLGTIALPGTLRGMTYGTVTRPWARMHHPLWAEEAAGDRSPPDASGAAARDPAEAG